MENLTLELHKSRETKNKVVYGPRTGASSRACTSTGTRWETLPRLRSRSSYPRSEPRF